MLQDLKNRIYYFFAKKNWGVRREYGPYVETHGEEHQKSPWKHWWLLIRLNWHYRVLRKSTYLLPEPDHSMWQLRPGFSGRQALFDAEACGIKRWSPERMANYLSGYDVVSFDVFDTLVFRPFYKPVDAFLLLEAQNGLPGFTVQRQRAEERARAKTKKANMEIDIFDIYEELSEIYSIDPREMAQREIEMERQICYANPYMYAVYEQLCSMGTAMIAVSDMYLPERYIRSILDQCGFRAISDVHVSCDYGLAKADGKLQRAVQQKLGQGKKVIHVDDTPRCIEGCKKAGWQTFYYRQCSKIRAAYPLDALWQPVSQMYRGIVNNYLYCGAHQQTPLEEFGFTYAGIAACGFCEWLTEFCREHRCDRILFLAHGMDIFYQVYQKHYDVVPSAYVQASRSALQELVSNGADAVVKEYFQNAVGNAQKICVVGLYEEAFEINALQYLIEQKWGWGVEVCGTALEAVAAQVLQSLSAGDKASNADGGASNSSTPFSGNRCSEETVKLAVRSVFSSTQKLLVRYEQDACGTLCFICEPVNQNALYAAEIQKGISAFAEEFARHRKKYQAYLPMTAVEAFEPLYMVLRDASFSARVLGDLHVMPCTESSKTLFDLLKGHRLLTDDDENYHFYQKKTRKLLADILKDTGEQYDDIYIYKHHIGEIYLYLNMVKKYVRKNGSRKPLLLINEERYIPLYKMFVPDMAMQYIPLDAAALDENFRSEITYYDQHRFFSPTPDRFEELRYLIFHAEESIHFYDYIRDSLRLLKTEVQHFSKPHITQEVQKRTREKVEKIGLNQKKYIVVFPEAVTASELSMEFWTALCAMFETHGYDIFVNQVGQKYRSLCGKRCDMALDEIYCLASRSDGVFALINGLVVSFAQMETRRYFAYTDQTPTVGERMTAATMLDAYGMEKIPDCNKNNLFEIDMSVCSEEELLQKISEDYEFDRKVIE